MPKRYETFFCTDAGTTRPINEDAALGLHYSAGNTEAALAAVADGVGGLTNAGYASTQLLEEISLWWGEIDWAAGINKETLKMQLEDVVKKENDALQAYGSQCGKQTGTTFSMVLTYCNGFFFYHVGDSRVYRFSWAQDKKLAQLSEDHALLLPKEIGGGIVMKSYLTQCVGFRAQFCGQSLAGSTSENDVFLVCSDGVYKTVSHSDIEKTVRRYRKNLKKLCQKLIVMAKKNGETDNITAAAIRVCK